MKYNQEHARHGAKHVNSVPDEHPLRLSADTIETIQVPSSIVACRIDQYIAQQFPHYSRSFFKRLILQHCILLNDTPVLKAGATVTAHDVITIKLPSQGQINAQSIQSYSPDIALIYQHEHFLIIYKPAGLTTHKPNTHSTEITLVDWLLLNHAEIAHVGAVDRPGIVHRLDKNTSGLLIISRTNYAHGVFTTLFKERAIKKTYLALVKGHPPRTGTIDLAIMRHPTIKTKMTALPAHTVNASSSGTPRAALTHYEIKDYFDEYSLVTLTPITGRTHQIRAHCAAIGHPVLGDAVYGDSSPLIDRHALHAHQIAFTFDGTPYVFTHPLPTDMDTLIKRSPKSAVAEI